MMVVRRHNYYRRVYLLLLHNWQNRGVSASKISDKHSLITRIHCIGRTISDNGIKTPGSIAFHGRIADCDVGETGSIVLRRAQTQRDMPACAVNLTCPPLLILNRSGLLS